MPGNTGSFAAYLEYTQRVRSAPPLPAKAHLQTGEPVSLLHLLVPRPNGSMTIGNLARASNLSAGLFYDTLKSCREAGLIQLVGSSLEETVTVTARGRDLATLAQD